MSIQTVKYFTYKFSKFKAFTLAEVLVTLAIIGVVAALTIPSLVTTIQEQQYRSAWKKNYSVFSQAVLQMVNDNEGVMPPVCGTIDTDRDACCARILNYLKYVKSCNTWGSRECFPPDSKFLNGESADYLVRGLGAVLHDGAMFDVQMTGATGITIKVDVNGFKPPNTYAKDIYVMDIVGNTILPDGAQGTSGYGWLCPDPNASHNYGSSCSSLFLTQ